MSEDQTIHRYTINETPAGVIERLPRIGRLMIINSREGVTHERIGVIETVTTDGDWINCSGAEHDSRIHLPSIARMVIDTSSVMKEKAYPRINFLDADGTAIFSAVSFAGMDPFIAALEGLSREPDTGENTPMEIKERAEALPTDPGLAPLNAALASAAPISIAIERPGFSQTWQGVVEKIIPSMGFINVMVPDFHFHLRAGSVGSWQTEKTDDGVILTAYAEDGSALGLTLLSKTPTAFETVEAN